MRRRIAHGALILVCLLASPSIRERSNARRSPSSTSFVDPLQDKWVITLDDEFDSAATAIQKGAAPSCFSRVPTCISVQGFSRPCPEYSAQLQDLNKCTWAAYDVANWMGKVPNGKGTNAFLPSEVSIQDGKLVLSAHKSAIPADQLDCSRWVTSTAVPQGELTKKCPIVSGGITSLPFAGTGGISTGFEQKYGRFEVRAKLSSGPGSWPAHWLVSAHPGSGVNNLGCNWPYSGEVDILELFAGDDDEAFQTLYSGVCNQHQAMQKQFRTKQDHPYPDDFHTFAVDWDQNQIRFSVDNVETGRITQDQSLMNLKPESDPSSSGDFGTHLATLPTDPLYLILNTSISAVDPTHFMPQFHTIDWVKVYRACTASDDPANCVSVPVSDGMIDENSSRGETAFAQLKAFPSPATRGQAVTAQITSQQDCDAFQVDVYDLSGRLMAVQTADGQDGHVYRGPMRLNEIKTESISTAGWAAGTYLLKAQYDGCNDNHAGSGNQAFLFVVL